jgi:Flp pilus assembly protein CpaB
MDLNLARENTPMSGLALRKRLVSQAKSTPTSARKWRRCLAFTAVLLAATVGGAVGIYTAFCNSPPTPSPQPQQPTTKKPAAATPAASEKVTLLVAAKSLARHTPIGNQPDTLFVEKQFVKDMAPKDAYGPADLPKLKGMFVKRPLRPGDYATAADLLALPPGMRPVTFPVTLRVSGSGPAAVPGSHLDFIWTARGEQQVGKLLLQDVICIHFIEHILYIGDRIDGFEWIVTVALSADDELRVKSALQTGSLRFVLRNFD